VSAMGTVVNRVLVLGCALVVIAVAAQEAHAGVKPQAPPQPRADSTSLQPDPWPSTSGESSSASTQVSSSASTQVSPPVSISVEQRTPATAANAHAKSRPSVAQLQRHTTPRQAAGQRALVALSGWPARLGAAAGLNDLHLVESSGSRGTPLFAAASALMLIVIAEASFLRLAGSRLGAARTRASSRRRPVDEPVAIRRVQLRR
jgi:hypothetical protein